MRAFSLASMLAFIVVGGALGWRLLRIARRTRSAPEATMGVCLFAIAAIGYPFAMASRAFAGELTGLVLLALGVAAVDVGLGAIFFFTQRVFHAGDRWLARGLALPVLLLAVHTVGLVASSARHLGDVAAAEAAGLPWTMMSTLLGAVGFLWSSTESFRYWRLSRRRLRLGLADPVVTNRFLLWGLTGCITTSITMLNAWVTWSGESVLDSPVSLLGTGVLGSANTLLLWLTFLPPAWYASRVRASAGVTRQAR